MFLALLNFFAEVHLSAPPPLSILRQALTKWTDGLERTQPPSSPRLQVCAITYSSEPHFSNPHYVPLSAILMSFEPVKWVFWSLISSELSPLNRKFQKQLIIKNHGIGSIAWWWNACLLSIRLWVQPSVTQKQSNNKKNLINLPTDCVLLPCYDWKCKMRVHEKSQSNVWQIYCLDTTTTVSPTIIVKSLT